jgi:hypothetical protein
MSDRVSPVAVSLWVAILVVLFAGLWLIDRRMSAVEDKVAEVASRPGSRRESVERIHPTDIVPRGGEPGTREPEPREPAPSPPATKPPPKRAGAATTLDDLWNQNAWLADDLGKRVADLSSRLSELSKDVAKLSSDVYDYYIDDSKDLHELQRKVEQLRTILRNIGSQGSKAGGPIGSWGLPSLTAPTKDQVDRCRRDAEGAGVRVADGRVEVRGYLNMSPNRTMPIEYFVTRWPESGHETLVHVIGPTPFPDLSQERLKGLPTAIYKGLVAAGFQQGEGSRFEMEDDPRQAKWVPPTGDVVYLGLRYRLHGKTHLARATDWVVDPRAKAVLPADCWRFTGSRRIEDSDTGDEAIAAEDSGMVVSVYHDPRTIVEIADPSNLRDDYQYNVARIPKPTTMLAGDEGWRVDVVRDWEKGTLTVSPPPDGERVAKPAKAPVLVIQTSAGETEVPFRAVEGRSDAWVATAEELKTPGHEWHVRMEVEGKAVETTAWEPLYLDLVFSKTPIVPEGDGAAPMEPVVVDTGVEPGTGPAPKDGGGAPPAMGGGK